MNSVLFIDDDVLALQLMSRISGMLGIQAFTSTSAACGLALAIHEKPALILVDMQMEEMDGSEFVRQVRLSPDIAHLPILICSAGIDFIEEKQALDAGADGFLQKPVGLKELSCAMQFAAQKSSLLV